MLPVGTCDEESKNIVQLMADCFHVKSFIFSILIKKLSVNYFKIDFNPMLFFSV